MATKAQGLFNKIVERTEEQRKKLAVSRAGDRLRRKFESAHDSGLEQIENLQWKIEDQFDGLEKDPVKFVDRYDVNVGINLTEELARRVAAVQYMEEQYFLLFGDYGNLKRE